MKKLYVFFLLLTGLQQAYAQNTFQALYGSTNSFFASGSYAVTAIQTPDGGYAVTGHTDDYADGDLFLLKTNATGAVTWYHDYAVHAPDKKYSVATSLIRTADGGYAITGSTYSVFGNDDLLVMKTDSLGNIQWHKVYGAAGASAAKAIRQTTTGEYIVMGTAHDEAIGAGYSSLYALRLNAAGDSLWTRTYGYPNSYVTAADVQITGDGNFVLGGTFTTGIDSSAGDEAPVLIKVNAANGNIIWSKTFGSSAINQFRETMYDFVIAPDGGIVLAGWAAVRYGYEDAWLMKTDAGGNNILWSKRYSTSDTSESPEFNTLAVTAGGYVMYGDMFSYATSKQFTLAVATDGSGNINWANRVGNGHNNYGYSVTPTPDNGYLFAGYEIADFGFQSTTAYVLKGDASGSTGCYETPVALGVNNEAVSISAGPPAYAGGGSLGYQTMTSAETTIPVTMLCQNPAPVLEFTAFKGTPSGSSNMLQWRTKSELKSDKYYIQRSLDKTTITTLGEVDASYKTLSNNPYSFTDSKPGHGANYYRIKAISSNGKITYSKNITIKTRSAVTVSNTTSPGVVMFRSDEPVGTASLSYSIYNAIGNKVYDGVITAGQNNLFALVNLAFLKDGIYYVHINNVEAQAAQQIVISH